MCDRVTKRNGRSLPLEFARRALLPRTLIEPSTK
jgi:hypothetical protein